MYLRVDRCLGLLRFTERTAVDTHPANRAAGYLFSFVKIVFAKLDIHPVFAGLIRFKIMTGESPGRAGIDTLPAFATTRF